MKLQLNKTYMARNGSFYHVKQEVMKGIYVGENTNILCDDSKYERWTEGGKHWSYYFIPSEVINKPELDLILPDSLYARTYSLVLKLKRKIKAFNNETKTLPTYTKAR